MTPERYQRLTEGQSNIARKVLSVVPLQEWWTAQQIQRELRRVTGSTPELHIIEGCLSALADSKLVSEDRRHRTFQKIDPEPREPVQPTTVLRAVPPTPEPEPAVAETNPKFTLIEEVRAAIEPADPIARLGALAAQLKTQADIARGLAEQIEEAALAAQENIERLKADTAALVQLKAIFGSLNK
jgi:hypothetical protein